MPTSLSATCSAEHHALGHCLSRPAWVELQVGDYEVRIKAYRIRSKYGDKVGSCFPEVGPEMSPLQSPCPDVGLLSAVASG